MDYQLASSQPAPLPQRPQGGGERNRFTPAIDIVLLQEVLRCVPFSDAAKWSDIVTNVNSSTGRNFTLRSIRERHDLILTHFLRSDRKNLRRSGTEEEYTVRDQLLQEVADIAREHSYKPKAPAKRKATAECQLQPRPQSAIATAEKQKSEADRDRRAAAVLSYMGASAREKDHSTSHSPPVDIAEEEASVEATQEVSGIENANSQARNLPEAPPESAQSSCGRGTAAACPTPTTSSRSTPLRGLQQRSPTTLQYLQGRGALENRRLEYEEQCLAYKKQKLAVDATNKENERLMCAEERAAERRIIAEERAELRRILTEERAQSQATMAKQRSELLQIIADERAQHSRLMDEMVQQQKVHLNLIETLLKQIKE